MLRASTPETTPCTPPTASPRPLTERVLWTVLVAVAGLAFAMTPTVAFAQDDEAPAKKKKKPVAEQTAESDPGAEGTTPGETRPAESAAANAPAANPRPWCGERPPMNIVVGYDGGKYFGAVEQMARDATVKFADSLCIDDTVRLATFGTKVEWLSPPIVIAGDAQREEIAKIFKKRNPPEAGNSVNDTLVKEAFIYWEEQKLADGEIPALYVFTDTMESDAPSRAQVKDFDWNNIPGFLANQTMIVVSLLDRNQPSKEPIVYTMKPPPTMKAEAFPSGGTTTYATVMNGFMPKVSPVTGMPESPVRPGEAEVVVVEDSWLSDPWNLGLVAGGALALVALAFAAGRSGRKRDDEDERGADKQEAAARAPAREVTFLLWDRMARQVVREETRTLEDELQIGASSNADFIVPGPYSMNLINEHSGPALRSSNMLGLEVLRSSGRRLTLSEHETVPVRSGDRLDIGGGHEVEVRIR